MLYPYLIKRRAALMLARSNYLIRAFERVKLNANSASHRIVSPVSKLVIEGPPRCGNSSALRLIARNNPTFKNRIATHIHRSFQIYYAKKYDIPAVVMLRPPDVSAVSHAALLCQLGQVKVATPKECEQLLKLCLLEYMIFARNVFNLGFKQIVPFEDHIHDKSFLIDYLNREFSLELVMENHDRSQQSSEAVHVLPSNERNLLKNQFVEIIETSAEIGQIADPARHYYGKLMAQRV